MGRKQEYKEKRDCEVCGSETVHTKFPYQRENGWIMSFGIRCDTCGKVNIVPR